MDKQVDIWFKEYIVDGQQILMSKDFDEDHYLTIISCRFDGAKADLKLSYLEEETRDRVFSEIKDEKIKAIVGRNFHFLFEEGEDNG